MFKLLRYFSMASFAAMTLAAFMLGWMFRQVEIENLLYLGESQNVALAQALSNSLWPLLNNYLQGSTVGKPSELPSHPVVPLLEHTVRHLIRDLAVAKIKVYNRRGTTIFSTDLAQIGEDQGRNFGFVRAYSGSVTSELIHRNVASSFEGDISERDLISTYVPLRRGERTEGVLEIYFDVTQLLLRKERTQQWAMVGVVGLFLVLYTTLFGIVHRADRIIKDQHGQLRAYVDEINQINASLETRVKERTETLSLTNRVLEAEIVERQKAEEQLRKHSRAVEQSPVSVVITDTFGRIEYVNPKFTQVTGFTAKEVIGVNPRILKSGEMPVETYRRMWEEITGGREWRGEFRNCKKSGELFWELASVSPIRDRNGKITHFIAVKEDITERKQADECLRQSEMRLRTILDNIVEGIVTINPLGVIESVNPAMERMFGYRESTLIGQPLAGLIPEVGGRMQHAVAEGARAGGESDEKGWTCCYDQEVRAVRQDGSSFPVELTISGVGTGVTVQYIGAMRDISSRKQAEAELEQARRKSFHQEKMAAIGTLAAGIVHEIGNPIAALSGLVEELLDSESVVEEKALGHLVMVQEQIKRLSAISREVSTFSMPQSDEFHWLDLNGLIESTLRLMRFDRRMRRVSCRMVLDRNLPAVNGSDNQIRQVLINLMINAADALEGANRTHPEVVVKSTLEGEWVCLEVEDNGIGMDQETILHATEAFFTTKPMGKGSGLGLSLCYATVEAHGGSMEMDSVSGQGTRVRLRLPMATEL